MSNSLAGDGDVRDRYFDIGLPDGDGSVKRGDRPDLSFIQQVQQAVFRGELLAVEIEL